MADTDYENELLRRWFPQDTEQRNLDAFKEKDITEISSILERGANLPWSRIPRIYIVLRKIDAVNSINYFLEQGITDLWFPFTQNTLPAGFESSAQRVAFLQCQDAVCHAEALNLVKSNAGHGHFRDSSDVPLKRLEELGRGASGFVDRVISTITYQEYALKLIQRGKTFRKNKQVLRDFERELRNLKRLSEAHRHIINLVGSYTEPRYVGILMSPVADCNLATFLRAPDISKRKWLIRSFFGCLTSAILYMHNNQFRHKDIKPSNILIHGDELYITDFGISIDWSEYGCSTTDGPTEMTPRYGAPEVAAQEPRNSSSDIWSLGCVFLEMCTVLRDRTLEGLNDHCTVEERVVPFHSRDIDVGAWISLLRSLAGEPSDDMLLELISNMLTRDRAERWTARKIMEQLLQPADDNYYTPHSYIGRCCLNDDETEETVESYSESDTQNRRISEVHANREFPHLQTGRAISEPSIQQQVQSNPRHAMRSTPLVVSKFKRQQEDTVLESSDESYNYTSGDACTRLQCRRSTKKAVEDLGFDYHLDVTNSILIIKHKLSKAEHDQINKIAKEYRKHYREINDVKLWKTPSRREKSSKLHEKERSPFRSDGKTRRTRLTWSEMFRPIATIAKGKQRYTTPERRSSSPPDIFQSHRSAQDGFDHSETESLGRYDGPYSIEHSTHKGGPPRSRPHYTPRELADHSISKETRRGTNRLHSDSPRSQDTVAHSSYKSGRLPEQAADSEEEDLEILDARTRRPLPEVESLRSPYSQSSVARSSYKFDRQPVQSADLAEEDFEILDAGTRR